MFVSPRRVSGRGDSCSLNQVLANFFCKGPDLKYFWHFGPYDVLQLLSSAAVV